MNAAPQPNCQPRYNHENERETQFWNPSNPSRSIPTSTSTLKDVACTDPILLSSTPIHNNGALQTLSALRLRLPNPLPTPRARRSPLLLPRTHLPRQRRHAPPANHFRNHLPPSQSSIPSPRSLHPNSAPRQPPRRCHRLNFRRLHYACNSSST